MRKQTLLYASKLDNCTAKNEIITVFFLANLEVFQEKQLFSQMYHVTCDVGLLISCKATSLQLTSYPGYLSPGPGPLTLLGMNICIEIAQ